MPTTATRFVLLAMAWMLLGEKAQAVSLPSTPPIACIPANNGVCMVPDAVDFHFRTGAENWVLVLNFGIVTARGTNSTTQLACEEAYGRKTPERLLVDRLGSIHVPGSDGILRAHTDSTCQWHSAKGIPVGSVVKSITEGANAPHTLWALVASGASTSIYRSIDGGESYQPLRNLPETNTFFQIDAAPGDPSTVYVTGVGTNARPALVRTRDNGSSFEVLDPTPAFPEAGRFSSLLGIAPDDPRRLYFSRSTPESVDEIWRSDDAGDSAKLVLRLQDGEVVTGFAFGASPGVLFVAGAPLLSRETGAPASLYVSRDLGATWDAPIPSARSGPRYRCLEHRGNVLYACGAGEAQQDQFLLGQSVDDGKTWTPVVTVATLPAPGACIADQCPATVTWLCEKFAVCDDTPAAGCGCEVGKSSRPGGVGLGLILWLTALSYCRASRRMGRKRQTHDYPC